MPKIMFQSTPKRRHIYYIIAFFLPYRLIILPLPYPPPTPSTRARHSSGSATTLSRDFSPETSCKSRLAQPSDLDKKLSNSALALPPSGAAARRIRRRPSLIPASSVFEAPGTAFISSRILSPSVRK